MKFLNWLGGILDAADVLVFLVAASAGVGAGLIYVPAGFLAFSAVLLPFVWRAAK